MSPPVRDEHVEEIPTKARFNGISVRFHEDR